MDKPVSLLDELRSQYEATRQSTHQHSDVPGFQDIDKQLRTAFRWLEKAIAYLDGVKPPIEHRFDLGYGFVFGKPRFDRGFVGQHEQRIVGYPVVDEINVSYTIAAAAPLTIEVTPGGVSLAEKVLDEAGLQYTALRHEDPEGIVRRCVITVPPSIPAAISFRADYQTGAVAVSLVNVDRFDRVTLAFQGASIDEPVLEDLIRLILGRGAAFLRRAPLLGIPGRVTG